jgi:hypothetical protein
MHGLAVGQSDDPQISPAIIPKTADLAAVSAERRLPVVSTGAERSEA